MKRRSGLTAVFSRSLTGVLVVALAGLAVGCDDDDDVRPPVADALPDKAPDSPAPVDTAKPDAAVAETNLDVALPDGGADATDARPDTTGDVGDGGTDVAPPPPADNDMAVVRFNANGTLDTTFGTGGIARVDLGAGVGTTRDSLWGIARDATDRVVLFGSKKADGATRTDSDRVVVRLTTAGALDATFGTAGVNTLNIANLGDNARNGAVQADGKIVASGYTNQPTGAGTQSANKVVLLRLLDTGAVDTTFGAGGVVNALPLPPNPNGLFGMAEAYSAGVTSTGAYVTTGYGRVSSESTATVDMVSFRFTPTGAVDTTWGTNGAVVLDLVGQHDRGRNLVVLPGDRVLITGSGGTTATNIDSMAVILDSTGARDATFGTNGVKLYDFERADDAFYGAAVAPSGQWAAAAGYRAGGGEDEDATLLLLPLAGAVGAEVAKPVPLSETENDRFWSVAFDASGKAVAAGFVRAGGDNWMAVARYNIDGTLDTTFGTAGIAKVNVAVAGTDETARGIVVQSDGKIVIGGNVEAIK